MIFNQYLLIPTAALGLLSLVLWLRLRKTGQQIQNLRNAVREYQQGIFDAPVAAGQSGSVAALGHEIARLRDIFRDRLLESGELDQKLDIILGHMSECIFVLSDRKRVLLMNPSAEAAFDIAPGSAKGKSLLETTRNASLDSMADLVLETKASTSQELELTHPAAKVLRVHAAWMAPPTGETSRPGNTGPQIILVLYDTTEIRRLENMRREFVANVSHELKTPLTSIRGFIETLLSGALGNPEKSKYFLEMMREDAERLSRLIHDLLLLSKAESRGVPLQMEPLDLGLEFKKVLETLKPLFEEKKITVENKMEGRGAYGVAADPDKLRQIILNLLDNAAKFNKTGGRIIISAEVKKDFIEAAIADTGIGIREQAVPRVFERFFRADESRSQHHEGTGLGLAIVKHLVEAHGGKVLCRKSRLGEGTEFSFTLKKSA